ncbi:MAG: uroporphyrinogen decarboxylase family protein [Armatimonadota bacterium]
MRGEIPDRLPFNFWMDRDKMAELDEKWSADFRLTHYGADVIEAFAWVPFFSGIPMKTHFDGKTTWQLEPMVGSLKEVTDYPMPDLSAVNLLDDIRAKRAAYPDKAIFAMMLPPFAILEPLRMPENLFLELYDSADEIHHILSRATPVIVEAAKRVCASDIDALYLAHDICSRDGAMISPRHLREFHFDYMKPIIDIAHEAGKKVFYHSDGYILPVLDIYVEYGIDGCNPLEPRYNDLQTFADTFGDKLMLYGGGDNCGVIPDGTVEQVREHVRSRFETAGSGGGYIFSTHDIPGHCPQENLDAMVDEIKKCVY